MNPIIDPGTIYLICVIKNLDIILILTMILPILFVVMIAAKLADDGNLEYFLGNDPDMAAYWKMVKWSLIISAVSMIIKIFLPTEKEMYAMAMANYITPDNLEMVKDSIIDFIKEIHNS